MKKFSEKRGAIAIANGANFSYILYASLIVQLIHLNFLSGIISASEAKELVKFYYYLDKDTPEQLILNTKDVNSFTKFRQNAPTFIIVDGFLSHLNANMTKHTQNGLFQYKPNSNVIVVDWSQLSGYGILRLDDNLQFPQVMSVYNAAKSGVKTVAGTLAKFLNNLVQQNYSDYSKMHLIGYSLGAHIAGIAGSEIMEKYNGKITRITGLDPAGLGFAFVDRKLRLDKSDAEFVDIYYSSRYSAGDSEFNVGHVDVYINGGSDQPGCESNDYLHQVICNHAYAWKVWNNCTLDVTKCLACPCHEKECERFSSKGNDCSNGIPVGINISMDIYGDYYLPIGQSF